MIKMHHLDAVDHVQSSRDIVTLGTQVWKQMLKECALISRG